MRPVPTPIMAMAAIIPMMIYVLGCIGTLKQITRFFWSVHADVPQLLCLLASLLLLRCCMHLVSNHAIRKNRKTLISEINQKLCYIITMVCILPLYMTSCGGHAYNDKNLHLQRLGKQNSLLYLGWLLFDKCLVLS